MNTNTRTGEQTTDYPPSSSPYVAVGFDGYIDTLVRPVRNITQSGKTFFPTIDSFGQYLKEKSGLSCSIDMHRQTETPGGNAFLFANSLSALGTRSHSIGAFGHPDLHPAFIGHGVLAQLEGIANPGNCNALEFQDGKVMMACNGDLDTLDFSLLEQRVGIPKILGWLENAQAAAFLNWSELPRSSDLWKGLLDKILPQLSISPIKKWLLLDISDCSRRSGDDLKEMVQMMRAFRQTFRVVFSLNYNEAKVLCKTLGCGISSPKEAAQVVHRHTGADLLALHLSDSAWGVDSNGCWNIESRHIARPTLSTGGGDNFNAGLLHALLEGQSNRDAIQFANTVSSLYVENGKSPTLCQIKNTNPQHKMLHFET